MQQVCTEHELEDGVCKQCGAIYHSTLSIDFKIEDNLEVIKKNNLSMTPKEKAKELYSKFMWNPQTQANKLRAKQCALIAVDEIMSAKYSCGCEESVVINGKYETYFTYWKQVKEEINNL